MEKRRLGRTDAQLSVIGFGGILVTGETPGEAGRLVAKAVARGINYFDVAPTYGDAEERLGPALEPFRRDVFLACKTTRRLAAEAETELACSLDRLKTDRLDLYQLHGVASMAEAETILAPGGALEAFLRAREKGRIRYIGFSAHSEEAALRLLDAFAFDSVLFPINAPCWETAGFGPRLAARAAEKGVGLLALKAMARRPLRKGEPKKWSKCWYVPVDTPDEVRRALAFTLARPVTAALTPGHEALWDMACDAVEAPARAPAGPFEGEPLFGTKRE